MACPLHPERIEDCPLYWAAHDAEGLGCNPMHETRGGSQLCAVERGADGIAMLAKLFKARPDYERLALILAAPGGREFLHAQSIELHNRIGKLLGVSRKVKP
jgi:hypothetical protein